jgi:hypothetical protein
VVNGSLKTARTPESSSEPVATKRPRLPDVLGVLWVLAAGIAVLLPALFHGIYLGPYDILTTTGLTVQHGGAVHNPSLRDLIALFIPFTEQTWTQVHHGHLPLWNPYSGLGMPLAFNWESAPFGLPALIGYLVPLQLAYTVGVLVTVVVAGTGAYVFARVLRLGVVASAFVGTVFILSGPMMSLVGWSSTSVGSWSGWLFATAVLVIRGRRRSLNICAFAVVVAMTIYAGHPETTLLLVVALALFLLVIFGQRALGLGASGPILRPLIDLVVAGLAGVALSAPLLLPGMQLIGQSGRTSTGNYASVTIPDHAVLQLIFQGFDGLPVASSHWFGSVSYQWTANYVGLIALVMAVVAIGTRWRRPEVVALSAVITVMAALALVPAVASGISGLPLVGNVILSRALVPLGFGLSVVAGFGLDALVRAHSVAQIRHWAGGAFGFGALLLVLIWLLGRGHLPPDEARIREASFLWPAISALVGLAVVAGLSWVARRDSRSNRIRVGRVAGGILLACETAFLVTAGVPLWSSSTHVVTPPPAVISLQKTVGSSLVGVGAESCIGSTFLGAPEVGILPEANILFQVHELAIYDPLVPNAYFSAWRSLAGTEGGSPYLYQFCPAVTSVTLARQFGVAFVLEPQGAKGPTGSVFVRAIGNEQLYRIPGAAPATTVPAPTGKPLPSNDAAGTPVKVDYPDPATWRIATNAATPQVLRLRITDVPGWHATIDGRPLDLQRFSGVMLQARLPSGRHTIVVHYWPTDFTIGLILAATSTIGLLSAVVVGRFHRRRSATHKDQGSIHGSSEPDPLPLRSFGNGKLVLPHSSNLIARKQGHDTPTQTGAGFKKIRSSAGRSKGRIDC